jgi:poly(3-hydroxyalkanoate) depolymerase
LSIDQRMDMTTHGDNMTAPTQIRMIEVDGQTLRVGVRPGTEEGPPLLIFNGIGANLELVEPFTTALAGVETVVFDVPGVGGSPTPTLPYRFSGLARLANRLMIQLGYAGQVDVLGVSWGGALAQQFAFLYPQRCRRLVLAATSPGALMVPGRLSAMSKLVNPRRYMDPGFLGKVGAELYGGAFRRKPDLLHQHARHIRPPRGRGYLYQLLAGAGWSSLLWLRLLRQPTLVMAGTDDPIIPLINAKILASLIHKARLHVVDDGHLFLISRATDVAPVIRKFLGEGSAGGSSEPTPVEDRM